MARHSQPLELAKFKGANKKNPQRYGKTVPKSTAPLGKPPAYFTDECTVAWNDLVSQALPGVLTGADRFILEVAAALLAEFRSNPVDFAVGKYTHLIGCLARLGLTPSDRQRLGVDKPAEDSEFEDF